MEKAIIIGFLAFTLAACTNSAQVATQPTPNANSTSVSTPKNTDSLVTSSHSSDKTAGANNSSTTSAPKTQTESPMAKAIDVSEMNAAIEKAEKDYKAKQTNPKAKETLAEAYFARAFALTEAAQYRAALGDFRKGLKLNPDNKDAKAMHDRIISIFKSINREPPKEGEEPPPMPFKKG
ncbi:MAG TPA: tetratricopeptide repeat protein [Pyrinomonadaceae bacterium]